MATDTRTDPYRGFNFRVEIEGIDVAAFSEVSGLMKERDIVEYRDGTDAANTVRKLMGLGKDGNLVFKRGCIQDDTFWRWYTRIANGEPDRRNGSVVLLNEGHRAVMRWNFENAWVNKLEGPSLKASGNEVAIESMELCHEGLTLELEA